MNNREALAVITAMEKVIKSRKDEIREETDSELMEGYQQDGISKVALKVGGINIGDYIVTFSKPGPEVLPGDRSEFNDFMLSNGFADEVPSIDVSKLPYEEIARDYPEAITKSVKINPKWETYAERKPDGTCVLEDTDVPIPGVIWNERQPKNTMVKIPDPEHVCHIALASGLVSGLLNGGSEE